MYLPHPGLDRMEVYIIQYFYWRGVRESIRKEAGSFDIRQY